MNDKSILAIGAHPDDIELGCIGLLQKFKHKHMVIVTSGEKGGDELKRINESKASAELLGASIQFLSLPDTRVEIADLIPLLEEIVDKLNPDFICIPSGADTHQDHKAVHEAGVVATRDSTGTILGYCSPSAAAYFHPNWFLPLGQEDLNMKIAALRCHKTQRKRPYLAGTYLVSMARYWAMVIRSEFPYIEPFELVRHIERIS